LGFGTSAHIGDLPERPLRVGDTWAQAGPDGVRLGRIDTGTRGA